MAERIFRGFLFLSRRIFSRIFSPDFFSSFLWEKVPKTILQENPRENPPKFIQQKSPTHFCRGAGPKNAGAALCVRVRSENATVQKHTRRPQRPHSRLNYEQNSREIFKRKQIIISGSTPTPWSGPFRDHGLRPWSQSLSGHRKPFQ